MDAKEVNAVLDNLCDKIGTTADKLVPEFAGYYIARNCAWIILGLAILAFCIYSMVKAIRMYRISGQERKLTRSYINRVLDGKNPGLPGYYDTDLVYYDDGDIGMYTCFACISGIVSLWLLIEGITRIIGWILSPYAMTVMWIINAMD